MRAFLLAALLAVTTTGLSVPKDTRKQVSSFFDDADDMIAEVKKGAPSKVLILNKQELAAITEVVGKQCERMNKLGLNYWLDRGTLIGAARDGTIIPYDDDGDMAMLEDDYAKAVEMLNRTDSTEMTGSEKVSSGLPYATFRLTRKMAPEVRIPVYTDLAAFKRNGIVVHDPYRNHGHDKKGTNDMGSVKRGHLRLKMQQIFPLKTCKVGSYECKCPNQIDAYLTKQYDAEWHLPKPSKNYADSTQEEQTQHLLAYMKQVVDNQGPSFLTKKQKMDITKAHETLEAQDRSLDRRKE